MIKVGDRVALNKEGLKYATPNGVAMFFKDNPLTSRIKGTVVLPYDTDSTYFVVKLDDDGFTSSMFGNYHNVLHESCLEKLTHEQ